jgi:hypothetical protein
MSTQTFHQTSGHTLHQTDGFLFMHGATHLSYVRACMTYVWSYVRALSCTHAIRLVIRKGSQLHACHTSGHTYLTTHYHTSGVLRLVIRKGSQLHACHTSGHTSGLISRCMAYVSHWSHGCGIFGYLRLFSETKKYTAIESSATSGVLLRPCVPPLTSPSSAPPPLRGEGGEEGGKEGRGEAAGRE